MRVWSYELGYYPEQTFSGGFQKTTACEQVERLRVGLTASAVYQDIIFVFQATEAETKDDREVVCSEVFADVTGGVDNNAQGKFHQQKQHGGLHDMLCQRVFSNTTAVTRRYVSAEKLKVKAGTRFYQILAPYFNQVIT